jgi:hypothetical protein
MNTATYHKKIKIKTIKKWCTNWQIKKYKTVPKHSPQGDYVDICVCKQYTLWPLERNKNPCNYVCMETILSNRKW